MGPVGKFVDMAVIRIWSSAVCAAGYIRSMSSSFLWDGCEDHIAFCIHVNSNSCRLNLQVLGTATKIVAPNCIPAPVHTSRFQYIQGVSRL